MKQLGFSSTAKQCGIADLNEACEYLQNEPLFKNYYAIVLLVEQQLKRKIPLETLMGGVTDSQKFASSLTLFREAAQFLLDQGNNSQNFAGLIERCDLIFMELLEQGYLPCEQTLSILKSNKSEKRKQTTEPVIKTKPIVKPASVLIQKEMLKSAAETAPTQTHDFSDLSNAIEEYIQERETEWSFHYNFLGIMSLIYWLHDVFCGTDYLNNKSREVKINAATQLKNMIDQEKVLPFSDAEKAALAEGRLAHLMNPYGGLNTITQTITEEQEKTVKQHTISGF